MAYQNIAALCNFRRQLLRHVLADVDTQLLWQPHGTNSVLNMASWHARKSHELRLASLELDKCSRLTSIVCYTLRIECKILQSRTAKISDSRHTLAISHVVGDESHQHTT